MRARRARICFLRSRIGGGGTGWSFCRSGNRAGCWGESYRILMSLGSRFRITFCRLGIGLWAILFGVSLSFGCSLDALRSYSNRLYLYDMF